jgi:diguanylate cyclase
MKAQPSFTLAFNDPALEAEFAAYSYERTVVQARTAILVGVLVYLLYGLLDGQLIPSEHHESVWLIRLAAICVPAVVFALTFTKHFAQVSYLLLALVGFAAGVGFLAMFIVMPQQSLPLVFPGVLLVTFYTYNLVGTRFVYALWVDVALLALFIAVFVGWLNYPLTTLSIHIFFMIAANLIGGAAGYLREFQQRQLFLQEREIETQRQRHLDRSLHDALTGLPNRELLNDRIAQVLSRAHRENLTHAGLFIDLDGFKQVNDERGHQMGDMVLMDVARRLGQMLRDSDTVCRLGGDEFFVLLYGLSQPTDATLLAERLLAVIGEPYDGLPDHLTISASIGVCPFPYPGATVADIIARADAAMYEAKARGKNQSVTFDESQRTAQQQLI